MTKIRPVYGFHTVKSYLNNATENIQSIMLLEGHRNKRTQQVVDTIQGRNVKLHIQGPEAFQQILKQHRLEEAVHQGIIALIYDVAVPKTLEQLLPSLSEQALVLILDGITDPHNLGACLRVANATAVNAVIAPKNNSAPLNATAAKAASGASESVPYITVTNLAQTLKTLQKNDFYVYGMADSAPDTLYTMSLSQRIALVMGSEGNGMRELTRKHCDYLLNIPMLGDVESLNVSVASAVSLYEIRRRQNSFIDSD